MLAEESRCILRFIRCWQDTAGNGRYHQDSISRTGGISIYLNLYQPVHAKRPRACERDQFDNDDWLELVVTNNK
jgi:hypothetical protein